MATSQQIITRRGTLAGVGANVRVRINPQLLDENGAPITQIHEVSVSNGFIVASINGDGTFDAQNTTTATQTVAWTASFLHSVQYNATQALQATVGPAPGVNPSPDPALPVAGSQLPSIVANGFIKGNALGTALETVTYGAAANTVTQGNDTRIPTANEKAGLAASNTTGANPVLARNSIFVSPATVITANPQNIPHTLGVIPSAVFFSLYRGDDGAGAAGIQAPAVTLAGGVHTATDIVVTAAPIGCALVAIAIA